MRHIEKTGPSPELEQPIVIEASELLNLAVDVWRMETWLGKLGHGTPTSLPRHALRGLKNLLQRSGIETLDLVGRPYEPGLAVEIVESIRDQSLGQGGPVIDETVSPILLRQGRVAQLGKVVIRVAGEPLPLRPSDYPETTEREKSE